MGFQTAALRSESAALVWRSAAVGFQTAALGFCSAAFCRDAWFRVSLRDGGVYPGRAGWLLLSAFCRGRRFRVSSFDRAIYPPRREVPRHPLSRLRFMGVFTPVAAPPRPPIRASLGPARFTRVATQRQVPPSPPKCRGARFRKPPRHAPTTTAAPPRVLLSSVVVSRKRPHRGERFSPSGENSRSRKCAGDEERSDDSEGSRADRRSSARAATPRSGRKAVNRARQFFRQARLNEKRRARFWAASPTASPPSFAENPLDGARLERSGNRASEAKPLPRTNADEHTLDRDPRPIRQSKGNIGDEQGTT